MPPEESPSAVSESDYLLDDDLAPKSTRVRLRGKEYVLREAGTDSAVKFRNSCSRSAKMTDGKVTGVDGLADAEPLLVSLCLYEVTGPATEGKVSLGWVNGLPARVTKKLFQWVKDNSDLAERDPDSPKDKPATTDTTSP